MFRGLFRKYLAIFFSVVIFFVFNLAILGTNIYTSQKIAESAVSINLSGRQRAMSQRMSKSLMLVQDNMLRGQSQDADLRELAFAVNIFDTTIRGFRDGAVVTGGDGNPVFLVQVETEEGHRIVRDAYEIWSPYLIRLQPLLRSPDFSIEELEDAVAYMRANNVPLFDLMNALTFELERSANQRANLLWWVQIIGLSAVSFYVLYIVFIAITGLIGSDRNLAKARKETGEILGTVKEGLFLLDREYRLGSQYSKSLRNVLRREVFPEMPFMPVLEEMVSKEVYENARDYIELLFGDRVKEALVTSLNPLSQVEVRGKEGEESLYLNFNFNRVLEEGKIAHLLVTVQDVTELVQLTAQLDVAKGQSRVEVEVLLKLLNTDASVLRQFLDNVGKGLAQINERLRSEDDSEKARLHLLNHIMRIVHGIKGEAAALNIEMFEGYAHGFERELVGMREKGEVRGEDMVRITVLLDGFYERLASITNIAEKMAGSGGGVDADERYLQTFVGSVQNLASRIANDEQKAVDVVCDLGDIVRLPRRIANELNSITIQLLRNAVKHGIEAPAEREAQGKSANGEIHVECKEVERDEYEFTVRDDGRGISAGKIRKELVQKGLLSEEDANALSIDAVMLCLFEPGFSTAATADRDAGHGVGLDVVAEKIMRLRGHLTLNSKAQAFTEFKIRFSV
ncbi:MAG: type IV pili methyl-accepting chemotaxis transducer N-terminal domain-containing protein [Burkholderiales bacterium]|jgi:signal transduction histidine kinase|nr:type IV pili methyl-accepting chemotaxis transducer N-terminal domain-containing protein [Burkholderiales bacterium]